MPRKINSLFNAAYIALKGRKYDVIYDAVHGESQFLGILRRMRILKPYLVTVMHQSPYASFVKYGKADAYIFFPDRLRDVAISENVIFSQNSYVNVWGPDLEWYNRLPDNSQQHFGFCIDNGKSHRDVALLLEACKELQIDVFSYGSKDLTKGNIESDEDMLHRVSGYDILAIPVIKQDIKQDIVCGLTSYMDALALRMPILASDNVSFAWEVEKYGLGMLYKTGDLESLKTALKKLHEDRDYIERCKKNITTYTRFSNINEYSKRLKIILDKLQ